MTDKEVRAKLLAQWKKLDEIYPPPICDGSGHITVKSSEPVMDPLGHTAQVVGGGVKCPGCEACTGIHAANAIKNHCGGIGLVVGCPVCKKRWNK